MGRGQSEHQQAATTTSRISGAQNDSTSHSSPPLTNAQIADRLEELNRVSNHGQGISFIRDVVSTLRRDDFQGAKAIYTHDRDKLELRGADLRTVADQIFGLELI